MSPPTGFLPVPIPPTGPSSNFSAAHQANPYRVWKARVDYIFRSGLVQRGVAMPAAAGGSAPSPGSTPDGNLPPGATTPTPSPAASAAPRVNAAITQQNAPYMAKTVDWWAEREGAMPQIPSPATTDPNEVFADFRVSFYSPDLASDGGPRIWRADGHYEYLLKQFVAPGDAKFAWPAPPTDIGPLTTVPASVFQSGMIG